MDPVTHTIAGALSGRVLAKRFSPWKIFFFCVIAAWVPDLDSFVGFGPEEYLLYHRAFTHSILGIPLLAGLLAGIFKLFWKQAPFLPLFGIGSAVMALQVYLDLATTFGTMILWPFTDHRFGFPGIFIIDPVFTLVLGILLLLTFVSGNRRRLFGFFGLLLAVVYPLFSLGIGTALESMLTTQMRPGTPYDRIHVTTDLFTPWYWKVVAEGNDHYGLGASSLFLSISEPPLVTFQKPDPDLVDTLRESDSFFRTWFWFAQFPAISSIRETAKGREITFLDLRFYSRSPIGRKIFPDFDPPFTLTAFFDPSGKVTAYAYHRHGETLITRVPD
ncbi:MAG: metal-dependent hydrolase [Desulfovibrionales bacterium]